jgi:hypothetical protein
LVLLQALEHVVCLHWHTAALFFKFLGRTLTQFWFFSDCLVLEPRKSGWQQREATPE